MPTVLVEMHHLKPYRQRVLGAYSMMEGALRAATTHLGELRASISSDRQQRPESLVVSWARDDDPTETIPFLGMAYERYESAASGEREIRYLGRTEPWNLPVTGQHPKVIVQLPLAWWVPAAETEVIELLDIHRIEYERIETASELELDTVRMKSVGLGPVYDVRVQMSGQPVHRMEATLMPAGSVRVPYDQPLGLLAAALLEPEAMDSLFTWGFFPEMGTKPGSMERFISASLARSMLEGDPDLRSEFEDKLAQDPAFASDAAARLRWFQDRSGYADDGYGLYPIRREIRSAVAAQSRRSP